MQYQTPVLLILGAASDLLRGQEKNAPTVADGHPVYHSTNAAYEVDE